jgi:hypothetical protein
MGQIRILNNMQRLPNKAGLFRAKFSQSFFASVLVVERESIRKRSTESTLRVSSGVQLGLDLDRVFFLFFFLVSAVELFAMTR